jgi:parvulin-like peptidyl-prolyl isomerase
VELSVGQWHGPVLSGYGVHLVYVDNVSEPPAPVFAEVRERVMQDWKTEKSEELNEKFYANLRDRYTVVIEELKEEDKVTALKAQAP